MSPGPAGQRRTGQDRSLKGHAHPTDGGLASWRLPPQSHTSPHSASQATKKSFHLHPRGFQLSQKRAHKPSQVALTCDSRSELRADAVRSPDCGAASTAVRARGPPRAPARTSSSSGRLSVAREADKPEATGGQGHHHHQLLPQAHTAVLLPESWRPPWETTGPSLCPSVCRGGVKAARGNEDTS